MNEKSFKSESSEQEQVRRFSSLLRHFENSSTSKPTISNSLNNLIFSFPGTDKDQLEENVQNTSSCASNDNLPETKVRNDYNDNSGRVADVKKPPIPQRRQSFKYYTPTPPVRNIIKHRMSETNIPQLIEEDKCVKEENVGSPLFLFPEVHNTDDLSPYVEKEQKPEINLPVPRSRKKVQKPIIGEKNLSLTRDEEEFVEFANRIPLTPTEKSATFTRKSLSYQVDKDNIAASTSGYSTLPSKLKSNNAGAVNNKGAVQRTQTISRISEVSTVQNDFYAEEGDLTSRVWLPQTGYSNLGNENSNRRKEHSTALPLPPKSLALRRSNSSFGRVSQHAFSNNNINFEQKSPDLEAVQKLKDLKSIFASTSANKNDKYNKIIVLLIDIMMEAIQETSPKNEVEERSAWYSNMKDFVHRETIQHRESQLQGNNLNISYDTLLHTMAPKFMKHYLSNLSIDESPRRISEGNEDDYEKVEREIKKENDALKRKSNSVSEKTLETVNDIIQGESKHLTKLESYINEYLKQGSYFGLVSTLENLSTMHGQFKRKLEEKNYNFLGILQTFLNFEDLFSLYVEFFCNGIKLSCSESSSRPKDTLGYVNNLSAMLFNRLTTYRLFIRKIVGDLEVKDEKIRNVAEMVSKMLNETMEKCNDGFATISSTISDNRSELTKRYITRLVPASHDWTEYGYFLLKDPFKIDKHKTNFTVFLFEKIMIITQETSKDDFEHKYSLKLNELVLLPKGKNKKALKLKDYFRSKIINKDIVMKFEANSEEVEKIWRKEISECLWKQLNQQKEESKKQPKIIPNEFLL